MRGMLVAAGFGTRLDPLTNELPKPAVPVANRPVAAYALHCLVAAGVRELAINTHHLARELQRELEPWCPPNASLRWVHEPSILGTGGGVRNAWKPLPDEDFVVMNAKLIFAPDLARALQAHRESHAVATMVLRPLPSGTKFAPVEVDTEGRVWRIRGIGTAPEGVQLEPRMYTGVQILHARGHADLPLDGDIIEHAYAAWLARGERVQSVTDTSHWIDVGVSLAAYLEANLALTRGEVPWPGITPHNGCIVAPTAHVPASAQLTECTLGDHVTVAEHTRLTRVVAWQGAHIDRPLTNAIVTSSGHVVAL